ncbi:MAG: hypothetical protein E6312_01925 [Peptoniphilus grossensis]|uniref:hypothetical protein n=1 Tax=Peptoniphilus grossensis TaxID=1465756 RepID=UPI00291281B2|nr:hypothetical protein [Peptoniphilus grossensis]MDU7150811.1 hypothetical protein [Peptoniphilus grossensis]
MKKKILILLGVLVVGGIFAYPQIRNKMLEAEFKRQNPGVDIIGRADGPTAIFTTNNKNKNKNKDKDGEKNNNQKAEEASAIGIIGGADDSGVLYPKVDSDAEFTFQASDFLRAKDFIFESSSVKSDLEKDYDNAARAFGFGSEAKEPEKDYKMEDATIIGAVINSKGFSGDKLVLDINSYSNVKSLMKSTYILGFEDENGKEIKELKVRINSSEPEDHQNVREEIGGIDKYKKVIIFFKQVEVVEDNDCTSYLTPIQNLTIENKQ